MKNKLLRWLSQWYICITYKCHTHPKYGWFFSSYGIPNGLMTIVTSSGIPNGLMTIVTWVIGNVDIFKNVFDNDSEKCLWFF